MSSHSFWGESTPMKFAALYMLLAVALTLRATGDDGMASQISAKNFEIAGITLGLSTDHDVEQILGAAPAVDTPDHEGARRCYLSASGDGTVLEIESWVGTVIQFRLGSRPNATEVRCARSSLVSRKIATGKGLKLGLLRKQVISILGTPKAVRGPRLEYEQSLDRPLTAREKLRLKGSRPPWDVKSVHVMNRIEIVLSDGKVTSICVLHNETD